MSIRRTNKKSQKEWLSKNNNLKILDLGCTHVNYWKEANHFSDIVDYSDYFKKINAPFKKIPPSGRLPFKDKEFDYIILSHVMEHVPNLIEFKKEIERIGKAGYIELPTKLNDNIVFGCDGEIDGHKWWFEFDDEKQLLLYTKKVDAIEKFLSVAQVWKFQNYYEDSFILQFYWEDKIDLHEREPFNVEKKITFFTLIKKYFSKKIRVLLSKLRK
tara:strand:+ start:1603 stop:2247 length:645 start_codon:yes stop_codon:yes gene_type:complete